MAKFFPILIEVEDARAAAIARLLDRTAGVNKVHMNYHASPKPKLLNGANTYGPNRKQRSNFSQSGEQRIIELLFKRPVMSRAEIQAAFVAEGRSGSSINSCLHKLRTTHQIETRDDGWGLTKSARNIIHAKKGRQAKKRKG